MMENSTEIWQVDAGGQVYETNFEEMKHWIAEGSLLPQDKVRRGNLRWIEAKKVPALNGFFNAFDPEVKNQVVTSTSVQNQQNPPQAQGFSAQFQKPETQNFQSPPPPTAYQELTPETEVHFCAVHTDAKAKYHCGTCGNHFCKACPKSAICPMCGATCDVLTAPEPIQPMSPQTFQNQEVVIDESVRKAAPWFYWKAGFTVINSILIMAGVYWSFFIGLVFPQFLHGIVIGMSEMDLTDNSRIFHGLVFAVTLVLSGLLVFFGTQARKAKKWAFVLGIIVFAMDCLLYLVTFSIFGVLIHGFAIYHLVQGYSKCSAANR